MSLHEILVSLAFRAVLFPQDEVKQRAFYTSGENQVFPSFENEFSNGFLWMSSKKPYKNQKEIGQSKDSARLSNLFSGVCWIVNGQPEEESKTKNAKDSKDRS